MRSLIRNVTPFTTVAVLLACTLLWQLTCVEGGDDSGFGKWMSDNGRRYASATETKSRYQAFVQNDAMINQHNERHMGSATFGRNQFSDLTLSQMERLHMGIIVPSQVSLKAALQSNNGIIDNYEASEQAGGNNDNQSLASSPILGLIPLNPSNYFTNPMIKVNWSSTIGNGNYVSPVKNQGSCGSCWAFSAMAAIESAFAIHKQDRVLLNLSEQELLDCSTGDPNTTIASSGCNGGWPGRALNYIAYSFTNSTFIKQNGAYLESDYPYTATSSALACKSPLQIAISLSITNSYGYTLVASTHAAIQQALREIGPLSIVVAAGNEFQLYKRGILKCSYTYINHAVLLTGYVITKNDRSGNPCGGYYIIKNTWGTAWGEYGYIRIGYGSCAGYPTNPCQMLYFPIYPTLA